MIPSLPGYGFSGKPTRPAGIPSTSRDAWIALMRRLGYTRFVAQGGDWGAQITDPIGPKAPPELLGIHSNMPGDRAARRLQGAHVQVFGTGHPAPTACRPTSSAPRTS